MTDFPFLNRVEELRNLDEELKHSRLTILMGRRRIGKSALIKHWAKTRGSMAYSQAIEHASISQQIKQIWLDFRDHFGIDIEPNTWEELLTLIEQSQKTHTFVIDEFPYILATDASLPSRLQRWLDHKCPSHISLCLLGSSQSMMRKIFLDPSAALYGRARRIISLKPLSYRHFCEFQGRDPKDRESFLCFSMVGGIPKYWQYIDPKWDALQTARELFFSEHAFFENEILRINSDEQISNTTALAALEAIGRGAQRPSEIANRLAMKQTSLTKILATLTSSYLIQREIPFGESENNSKKVLYTIVDPFVRFFYSVFSPHRSRWDIYTPTEQSKLLIDHASGVFEQAYRQCFSSASRYFEAPNIELDCVRYESSKSLIATEIKFRSLAKKEHAEIRERLMQAVSKSRLVQKFAGYEFGYEVIDLDAGLQTTYEAQKE